MPLPRLIQLPPKPRHLHLYLLTAPFPRYKDPVSILHPEPVPVHRLNTAEIDRIGTVGLSELSRSSSSQTAIRMLPSSEYNEMIKQRVQNP